MNQLTEPKIKAKPAIYRRAGEHLRTTVYVLGVTECVELDKYIRHKRHWVFPEDLCPPHFCQFPEPGDEFSYQTKSGVLSYRVTSYLKEQIDIAGFKIDVFRLETECLGYATERLREVDITSYVCGLQKFGVDASAADIIHTLQTSEDTYCVVDGKTIRVYGYKTDRLEMTIPCDPACDIDTLGDDVVF